MRSVADSSLIAYGQNKLVVIAQFEAEIAIVGHQSNPLRLPRVETITVCKGTTVTLMSRHTAEYFKLLKVGPLEIDRVIEQKLFPMVPNFVTIDIDRDAPGQRREQMKVLEDYEEKGIIERVPPMEITKFVSLQFFYQEIERNATIGQRQQRS